MPNVQASNIAETPPQQTKRTPTQKVHLRTAYELVTM